MLLAWLATELLRRASWAAREHSRGPAAAREHSSQARGPAAAHEHGRAPSRGLGMRRLSDAAEIAASYLEQLVQGSCPSWDVSYTLPSSRICAHPMVQTVVLYAQMHRLPPSRPDATAQPLSISGLGLAGGGAGARVAVDARRETLRCPDGGTVAIDWLTLESDGMEQQANPGAPVVIAFPGVGECKTHSGFVPMLLGALLEAGNADGCTPIVGAVVYPGFNRVPLDSHKLPGTAYLTTDDAGVILRHAREKHPTSPLIVMGCSFGSALAVGWAGRNPAEAKRLRIGSILLYAYGHSVGSTVCTTDTAMAGLTGRIVSSKWRRAILDESHATGRANVASLRELEKVRPGFSVEKLRNARTIEEWDLACLPAYGLPTLSSMLVSADPIYTFEQLQSVCPVVLFNADDDWLCPSGRIEANRETFYARLSNVVIVSTRGGGHLGWVDEIEGTYGLAATNGRVKPKWRPRVMGEHSQWLVTVTEQLVQATATGKLQGSVTGAMHVKSVLACVSGLSHECDHCVVSDAL
ncbi:Alpha/Beta hydrolase protein [Pavlovales sp. CCMP2436]|nr:Alpha/Beta hydrolase protein [Pavlovales sp. CCMP2436]